MIDECNICFNDRKLYDVCNICNNKLCQSCILKMVKEDSICFTSTDITYDFKCPYCRTSKINNLSKDELIILYKKISRKIINLKLIITNLYYN